MNPDVRGVRVVRSGRGVNRGGRGAFLDLKGLHPRLALLDVLFQGCEALPGLVK